MNAPNLLFLLVGALVLAAGPVVAQTEPGVPPSRVAPSAEPDADDQPGAVPGVVAPKAPGAPDWTFEEVLGGEVTVGPEYSPVAMGIGAVAGVVAFNLCNSMSCRTAACCRRLSWPIPTLQPAASTPWAVPSPVRWRGSSSTSGRPTRRNAAALQRAVPPVDEECQQNGQGPEIQQVQ